MMEMKADRVFPEPVGEQMMTFFSSCMSGMASLCGGVKISLCPEKDLFHHSLTVSSKRLRISSSSRFGLALSAAIVGLDGDNRYILELVVAYIC